MFGGISVWELTIILLIVLIIFGAGKLPEIGAGLGKAINNFKKASTEEVKADKTRQNQQIDEKKDA